SVTHHVVAAVPHTKTYCSRRSPIARVAERDLKGVVVHRDRQRTMEPRQSARDEPQDFLRNFFAELDEFRRERFGDDLIKSALIDKSAVDERLLNGFSVELRLL